MTEDEKDDKKGDRAADSDKSTRWWEQYYVRYFVGTVVAVAILFILREKASLARDFQGIIPSLEKADGWQLSAVASAGLAYCYIASTPVLILHAVRGGLQFRKPIGWVFLSASWRFSQCCRQSHYCSPICGTT